MLLYFRARFARRLRASPPPMLYADADSARALDVLLMMQRLSLPPFLTLCLERALPPSLPVRANSHVACADQEGGDSLR